jgi:hypothetical protein
MPTYRFYIFEDTHVAAPPRIYELPNNAAALEAARTINGCAVEVWRYTKKIARLNPLGKRQGDADHRKLSGLPQRSAVNGLYP